MTRKRKSKKTKPYIAATLKKSAGLDAIKMDNVMECNIDAVSVSVSLDEMSKVMSAMLPCPEVGGKHEGQPCVCVDCGSETCHPCPTAEFAMCGEQKIRRSSCKHWQPRKKASRMFEEDVTTKTGLYCNEQAFKDLKATHAAVRRQLLKRIKFLKEEADRYEKKVATLPKDLAEFFGDHDSTTRTFTDTSGGIATTKIEVRAQEVEVHQEQPMLNIVSRPPVLRIKMKNGHILIVTCEKERLVSIVLQSPNVNADDVRDVYHRSSG